MTDVDPRFYRTRKTPSQTVSDLQDLLAKYGAATFAVRYTGKGSDCRPEAVQFSMEVPNVGEVPVELSPKTTRIRERLAEGRGNPANAEAVAWRQVYAHAELTLELVENGVREFHEIFMADVLVDGPDGPRRLVEAFQAIGPGALASPGRLLLPPAKEA